MNRTKKSAAAAHRWSAGWSTDTGLQRDANEDRIFADPVNGIFLVVDGLGGHAAGEQAAEEAVRSISELLESTEGPPEQRVREAISEANNRIFLLAQTNPEWQGMACVLTLALLHEDSVIVGHVGDSRMYLMWNGNLRKLTSDHSPVGEREDRGELTEAEAMMHPRRNEVFRDVGTRPRTPEEADFIDVRRFPFHPSAALLLCSDGLSDVMTSTAIAEILELYEEDAQATARQLVTAANDHGGTDNISVIFIAGEDFIGMNSQAIAESRVRHSVTRTRRSRIHWRRHMTKALWLVIGIALGMAIWAACERFLWSIATQ